MYDSKATQQQSLPGHSARILLGRRDRPVRSLNSAQPKKRTALGRFKHEAVNLVVAPDGRIAVYSGDDERFVSANAFNPDDRAAKMDLLDEGTLYVATFSEDGSDSWVPLTFGEGPLAAENGFTSQVDVLINARGAANLPGGH
jgi:hypothetical protein